MLHHLRPDTPLLFYSERQQQYYLLSDDAVCGPTLKRVEKAILQTPADLKDGTSC